MTPQHAATGATVSKSGTSEIVRVYQEGIIAGIVGAVTIAV